MRRLSAFCLALSLPITYSVSASVHAQAKNSNKTSVFQQVGGTTAEGAGPAWPKSPVNRALRLKPDLGAAAPDP